jgi:hypothetical protein
MDEKRPRVKSSAAPRWGTWESGATAALFALPAVLHVAALHWGGRAYLDAFEWLVVIVAAGIAFTLSLFAGGLPHGRSFLSVGLLTSCVWVLSAVVSGSDTTMVQTYFLVAIVVFIAQMNLIPVALVTALRTRRADIPDHVRNSIKGTVAAAIAAVAMLDAVPLVYVLSAASIRTPMAVGWMALCSAAAGLFAGMAVHAAPSAFRTPRSASGASGGDDDRSGAKPPASPDGRSGTE